MAEVPNSDDWPVENDEEPVLGSLSSPSRPRACSSPSVLVYISRYCVSPVPGVAGTGDDDDAGAGAGRGAAIASPLSPSPSLSASRSLSLPALSSSTARDGRSESVRRVKRHEGDTGPPPSRSSAPGSGGASVSSGVVLLRGCGGGGGSGCRMGEAVVD